VPNSVVADRLEDEKQDMLIFLRRKTGNSQLNLIIEVLQQETEIAPYTNKEKFESLAKKNPKLLNLKNELDLEIE
jgi:DNA polymerase-3 subunit gamma/tau